MNPLRGEVPLVLGALTLTLKLGINALCAAEPILGKKTSLILDDLEDSIDGPALETVRVLTWAGLRRHHPDYGLDQIGDMMDEFGPALFTNAILSGLASAFGTTEGKEGANPPTAKAKKKRGTG